MKVEEIRNLARDHGVRGARMKKPDLIRQIQLHEGNFACFGTAFDGFCDQEACLWREDCFRESERNMQ